MVPDLQRNPRTHCTAPKVAWYGSMQTRTRRAWVKGPDATSTGTRHRDKRWQWSAVPPVPQDTANPNAFQLACILVFSPQGGVRPFHQKSICLRWITSGPYVVQICSHNVRKPERTKPSNSTQWYRHVLLKCARTVQGYLTHKKTPAPRTLQ